MTSRAVVVIGLLAIIGLAVAPSGFAGHSDDGESQAFIVGFHQMPDDRARYQGGEVLDTDDRLSFFVVETHNPDAFEQRVKNDHRAQYLEVDHNDYELFYTPNDEHYTKMYGPQITNTETAWDTTLGSTSVIVGLLDTGITTSHEDFVDSRVSGWDYVNGDSSIEDAGQCSYHGSHTAGTAAATTDNGVGVAGMSQSSIIMHKIFDKGGFRGCGAASTSQIAQALMDLGDKGAHISSNSWGGGGASPTINNAIAYAHEKGVVHVAAAGNDGRCDDCVGEPWKTNADKVVIVACSTDADKACSFTSEGPEVDLTAPGKDILSVDGGGGYRYMSGTSMSTPHVSGAIGLYVAANGDASFSTIETALKATADTISVPDDRQGGGRLNTGAFVASGDGGGGGNSAPTASFTYSCTDLTCDFDGTGSSDPDDDTLTYSWDFGDSTSGTGATASHTYATSGDYTVTLTVDDGSATDTDSQVVSVTEGNSAPTASFTYSCTDLTCDFDGTGSSDPDDDTLTYSWDFQSDGTVDATGATASHTYATSGDYTVTLTVDDGSATDTDSQVVTVSDRSSETASGIHVGDLDGSGSSGQGGDWTATVTVTVHDTDHTAEGGATVSFDYTGSKSLGGSTSCTTASDGTCTVTLSNIHNRESPVGVTVTGISDSDGTYDASSNHDPDGDSDGTTITVSKTN